jgi:membrane protease YdiL (CAAX protease family)
MAASEPLPEPLPPRPAWPTWVEIIVCSGYPTQLLIGYLLVISGVGLPAEGAPLSGDFIFALSLIDTVLLLSLIVMFIRARGQRVRDVFFGSARPLGEIVAGVFSLPVVIAIVAGLMFLVLRFVPWLHNVTENPLEALANGELNIWMFLLVVIVAGGVREELQRAFLLQRFRDDLGRPWLGLLITSLSFGLGHTLQGNDAALITGALGAFWGLVYLTRRGALASIVSHSLFNSGELLRVFLGSA